MMLDVRQRWRRRSCARTPAPVVDRLARDIVPALATPDLHDWLTDHGGQPMVMTRPEFARFVVAEPESAAGIVNAARTAPR